MLGLRQDRAPFDGVVTRRGVDTGHLTVPGPPGEPLFVVARTDIVTIAVGVPETYAPLVGRGDKVLVRVQALGGLTVEGEVTRTAWALDTARGPSAPRSTCPTPTAPCARASTPMRP